MNIILYLLQLIQYQHEQICWFLNFICRYLPLRQWAFDDSHSPKYQKFKIDELPLITDFRQAWSFKISFLTTKSATVRRFFPSVVALPAISRTAAAVLVVMLRNLSFIRIMVPNDSFSAKSVTPISLLMKVASLPSNFDVLIAATLSSLRKTGNISSFINA